MPYFKPKLIFYFFQILSFSFIFASSSASASASSAETIFLFNFQRSLDPAVADCQAFHEKMMDSFPLPSQEYKIRSSTEMSCNDDTTTNVSFHILLAAEDSASVSELERYMAATAEIDLWGLKAKYRVVKNIVQTISIDAGLVTVENRITRFERTNREQITLVHNRLGRAIDVFKGFKQSFVRGDIASLLDFLRSISKLSSSKFILQRSNMIESYVSTVAVIDGGDVYALPSVRKYVRDCGIAAGKTCVDDL